MDCPYEDNTRHDCLVAVTADASTQCPVGVNSRGLSDNVSGSPRQ